jgi:hypothetical protein
LTPVPFDAHWFDAAAFAGIFYFSFFVCDNAFINVYDCPFLQVGFQINLSIALFL